jgi:CubicO group peptidase (beta-lactamase class C family)
VLTSIGRFAAIAILSLSTSLAATAAAAELTQSDADSWLDGFMPYTLESSEIAGAVVVIVKDGQVLTQRGFGYADVAARKRVDPAATMFRAGSISKLFTWTAIMQMVEQGRTSLGNAVRGLRGAQHIHPSQHDSFVFSSAVVRAARAIHVAGVSESLGRGETL